jgi:membrane associated rhomboid family serine protease
MEISATIILIIVTVLASLYAWKNPETMQKWIFNPYQISTNKQYHRFVTSGFIHNDYTHLFFNMFTFFFFGRSIESVFRYYFGDIGIVYFLALYILGIIISDIPTFVKHRNDIHYNALGASGGVSAIVFSWILFFPTQNIYIMALLPIPGFVLGLLFIVYSYYQGKKEGSRVNHDAHLYGAIFGIIFTVLFVPNVIPNFLSQLSGFF